MIDDNNITIFEILLRFTRGTKHELTILDIISIIKYTKNRYFDIGATILG